MTPERAIKLFHKAFITDNMWKSNDEQMVMFTIDKVEEFIKYIVVATLNEKE